MPFILIFAIMKLSIIVPVYNVAKTLERCVGSILSQDFADFEVLLVDDGSTDGSGILADRLAQNAARLTVFHKANGGLSDARNYGIERSSGEYVTFVDSDDELSPGTLSQLMALMEAHGEYDILEYPVTERPGRADEHLLNPGDNEYADASEWLSVQGLTHCWACNKVFKRWIFSDVRFPEGRKFEDMLVMGRIIALRPFIATTSKGMYLYHWNGGGITATMHGNKGAELLKAQIETVKSLGIDTRERRWHRLYLDMFAVQLQTYRATGDILLHRQRINPGAARNAKELVKALMANVLGVKAACRLFKNLMP